MLFFKEKPAEWKGNEWLPKRRHLSLKKGLTKEDPAGLLWGVKLPHGAMPPKPPLDSCEHSFQKDGAKGLSLKKETKKTLLAANDSYARRNATYPTFSVTPPSNKMSHFESQGGGWRTSTVQSPLPATDHSLF